MGRNVDTLWLLFLSGNWEFSISEKKNEKKKKKKNQILEFIKGRVIRLCKLQELGN